MGFSRWSSLAEAPERAPTGAGVMQVRVETGLIRYPRGQSAMVYYAASPKLDKAVTAFANSHRGQAYLCRWQECADPGAELERLLAQFERRFGSPPRLPK